MPQVPFYFHFTIERLESAGDWATLEFRFCLTLKHTVSSLLSLSHIIYQIQRKGSYEFPGADTGFLAPPLQCPFPIKRGKFSTLSLL